MMMAVRNEEDNELLISALKPISREEYEKQNRWFEVWNNRTVDLNRLRTENQFQLYKELKKLDGFDVNVDDSEAYYKSFYDSMLALCNKNLINIKSVYEVGCGSGANLIIFEKLGMKVGGIDYSKKLVQAVDFILPDADVVCAEAIDLPIVPQYDVVISDSVFAYFKNEEYGLDVLEKMYTKAKKQVILLEIFDKEKKEECISFRKSQVENYDEIYKNLDKTFYDKNAFVTFAQKHNCDIEFSKVENDYYWNSRYMYNCYITKR